MKRSNHIKKQHKEFTYDFSQTAEFFTIEWNLKKLDLEIAHDEKIREELRLENLTDKKLEITVKEHDILEHPKSILLKPKEVRHIKINIPCRKIKKKHTSYLVLSSKNQTEKIPINLVKVE
jgi:hypothetical protein